MEKISFFKMSGAGNDFILIDKDKSPAFVLDAAAVKKLCDRHNGIGADGVISIENSTEKDFNMKYFNADGSTGSLCGNGARCAIYFAGMSNRLKNGRASFTSNSENYSGEVLANGNIKFNLNAPKKLKFNFKVKAADQLLNVSFANTGSPHVLININEILINPADPNSFYKSIDDVPILKIGKEIRYHQDFSPDGTNVNFIDIKDGKVIIRTYERGVESETLACGTGSVAAALIAFVNHKLKPPVTIVTRGGDELFVDFRVENKKVVDLSLTGPTKIIYTGELLLNNFF
ncbi:MAG: diaminopimelate epimerase [Ignavibacteriales bacterium]|nr:MAG: diaminopimelate epimerase [Ignavibacteriales bacterium]